MLSLDKMLLNWINYELHEADFYWKIKMDWERSLYMASNLFQKNSVNISQPDSIQLPSLALIFTWTEKNDFQR